MCASPMLFVYSGTKQKGGTTSVMDNLWRASLLRRRGVAGATPSNLDHEMCGVGVVFKQILGHKIEI